MKSLLLRAFKKALNPWYFFLRIMWKHFALFCAFHWSKIISLDKKFYFFLFLFLGLPIFVLAQPRNISQYSSNVPEPSDYRVDDYRAPVPQTLKGARVITASEAEKLFSDPFSVFIDVNPRPQRPVLLPEGTVWREVPHATISGAHWLPNVGYGVLSREVENYFKTRLERLTENNKNRSVIFFCLKECWMSWNAAKRAISWNYTKVSWFPDGVDGWQMLGNSLVPVDPVP